MPRPIQATIHHDALAHNLERARTAGSGARVWAVVKADAYGHGIARVFPALRAADGFALLDLAEAETLRALGWGGPILLLEGCFDKDDLALCERLSIWHAVHDPAQINWLATRDKARAHRVFLKLNTGMNRLGFSPDQYREAFKRVGRLGSVSDVAHMTHFARADEEHGTDGAFDIFQRTTDGLPGERCLCNSAALLRHGARASVRQHSPSLALAGNLAADQDQAPRVATPRGPRLDGILGDWVRPGIMLYGSSPTGLSPDALQWGLRPAMSLCTRLIGVQDVAAGAAVGYGEMFRANRPMRVGVAAVGYGDGYPRHATTGTPIVVDGVRTRILGRVSMDMLAVYLEPVRAAGRAASVGSPVLCWGEQLGQRLSIDEVAASAGTLGYELMCALAKRVPVKVA